MITTNDPVSRFLKQSGYTPTPHRYLGSDFISGMQVQLNDLDLIYSVEDDTLVISQITATGSLKAWLVLCKISLNSSTR